MERAETPLDGRRRVLRRLARRLSGVAGDLARWLAPPPLEVSPGVWRVLELVYPTVDWRRVTFHRGMPHLVGLFPQAGITLPDPLRPGRTRVYIEPSSWRPGSPRGLGLAVHEGFHVLQVQDAWRGWGVGLLTPFYILYLACSAANRFRYPGHPLEGDAFDLAGRRVSRFEQAIEKEEVPWKELARSPEHGECELGGLGDCCRRLAVPSSGLAFWRRLAASTPGWRALTGAAGWLTGSGGWPRRLLALLPALPLAALAVTLAGLWLAFWTAAAALFWLAEVVLLGGGFLVVALLSALAWLLGR